MFSIKLGKNMLESSKMDSLSVANGFIQTEVISMGTLTTTNQRDMANGYLKMETLLKEITLKSKEQMLLRITKLNFHGKHLQTLHVLQYDDIT